MLFIFRFASLMEEHPAQCMDKGEAGGAAPTASVVATATSATETALETAARVEVEPEQNNDEQADLMDTSVSEGGGAESRVARGAGCCAHQATGQFR
jgi:hypothetical protein